MGANGSLKQEKCYRGHKLVEPNTKTCQNGGRRCRACECALSRAHNWKVRKGVIWTVEDIQDAADAKYKELVGANA
jgi:NAD-dependent SIR2 family protein deacetylase